MTVRDTYEGTARSDYLDTVVTAWLNKQDSVDQKGMGIAIIQYKYTAIVS